MGPHQFPTHFVQCNKYKKRDGKCQHNSIGNTSTGRIGIDASGMMHRALSTQTASASFDSSWDAVETMMTKTVQLLLEKGNKDITLFLDGQAHPMKGREELTRRTKGEEHIVYRRDDFTSLLVIECRKLGVKVFCSAPSRQIGS